MKEVRLARELLGNEELSSLLGLDNRDALTLFEMTKTEVDLGHGTETHREVMQQLAEEYSIVDKRYNQEIQIYIRQTL